MMFLSSYLYWRSSAIQSFTALPQEFFYPVQEYPPHIRSIDLDKTMRINGRLMGMKGQYWMFDSGVINIRKYSGYEVILQSPKELQYTTIEIPQPALRCAVLAS